MGLLDAVTGAATGFTDFASDFIGDLDLFGENNEFISDILGGAVTNSAIAAISGGDIGKAAMYGAVSGAFKEDSSAFGNLGGYGNEISGAISGYGVGDGMGALAGVASAYGLDSMDNKEESAGDKQQNLDTSIGDGASKTAPPKSTGFKDKMVEMGIMTPEGEGTLLGKGLLGGIAGMASDKMQNDLLDKQQDMIQENYQRKDDIDREGEQKRMGAFTNGQSNFKIQRS